jgi:hypothetical protein
MIEMTDTIVDPRAVLQVKRWRGVIVLFFWVMAML